MSKLFKNESEEMEKVYSHMEDPGFKPTGTLRM